MGLQSNENIPVSEKLINLLLSDGDACEEVNIFAQSVARLFDPKRSIKAKKMGFWGKLLLGKKNTWVLPFSNYVFLDEDFFQDLSDEEKRFVLGRCVVWMKNFPFYAIKQADLLLWIITTMIGYAKYSITSGPAIDRVQRAIINNHQENLFILLKQVFLGYIVLDRYINRNIVYDVDAITVKALYCESGAQAVLNKLASQDSSIIEKFLKNIPHFNHWIPGRLHNNDLVLPAFLKNIPIVDSLKAFPLLKDRVKSLSLKRSKKMFHYPSELSSYVAGFISATFWGGARYSFKNAQDILRLYNSDVIEPVEDIIIDMRETGEHIEAMTERLEQEHQRHEAQRDLLLRVDEHRIFLDRLRAEILPEDLPDQVEPA